MSATSNYNHHIHGWLEKIEDNIAKFRDRTDRTQDEKIEFITHQYHLVMLIYKALNGQVIFVGAKPISHAESVVVPVKPVKTRKTRKKKDGK